MQPTAEGGKVLAEQMTGYADVGIEAVHVMPFTGDPVAFVRGLCEHVVGRLSDAR